VLADPASMALGMPTPFYVVSRREARMGGGHPRFTPEGRVKIAPMAAEKTEHVMIRLTPDQLAEVKEAAQREERTVSQIFRLAVARYLSSDRAATA
jgi:hypothetical protein